MVDDISLRKVKRGEIYNLLDGLHTLSTLHSESAALQCESRMYSFTVAEVWCIWKCLAAQITPKNSLKKESTLSLMRLHIVVWMNTTIEKLPCRSGLKHKVPKLYGLRNTQSLLQAFVSEL